LISSQVIPVSLKTQKSIFRRSHAGKKSSSKKREKKEMNKDRKEYAFSWKKNALESLSSVLPSVTNPGEARQWGETRGP